MVPRLSHSSFFTVPELQGLALWAQYWTVAPGGHPCFRLCFPQSHTQASHEGTQRTQDGAAKGPKEHPLKCRTRTGGSARAQRKAGFRRPVAVPPRTQSGGGGLELCSVRAAPGVAASAVITEPACQARWRGGRERRYRMSCPSVYFWN